MLLVSKSLPVNKLVSANSSHSEGNSETNALRCVSSNSSLSGIGRQSPSDSYSSSGCMERATIRLSSGRWGGRHTCAESLRNIQQRDVAHVFCLLTGLRILRFPLLSRTMCSGASCCTSMKANPVKAAKMKTSRTSVNRSRGNSLW